ncbi:ABC transporter permease [Roseburia sp. 499]|uniref:ABC transporter permease n=1 Tax=Roseburia sp. 499 TaxID=1261634 RepID=UPI0009520613|nr:ABC transporter permease [Roseburia sp. 499]WVK69409.1 ABC transporter permease [Roseburia sp. 499]
MIELQYYLSNLPDALIYGLLAMGIYISLRILDIPDLTTEGSFGFGAVISVLTALNGHPIFALFAGMLAGACAGIITGFLQTKLKVHPVLAGIITMSGLYSINLVGYSMTEKGATTNLSYDKNTVFEKVKELLEIRGQFQTSVVKAVVSFVIVILVVCIMIWFFRTRIGLCIRATGDNPDMVSASSINVDRTKIIGLMIANALIGFSGALASQSLGYSDINTSNGTLIYGLAAVIIGEAILGKRGPAVGVVSAVLGSVLYKLIVALVIRENIFGDKSANLMKLTCALIVAITLAIPAAKQKMAERKQRKAER